MNEPDPDIVHDCILDSITEGVFTIDTDWRITSFNRAAEEITGIARSEALGRSCKDILRANICEGQCALHQTLASGDPIVNRPVSILDARGRRRDISITTAILRNPDGRVIGGVETFRDVSGIEKLRKALRRRYEFSDIISRDHRMHELFDVLPDIAASSSTVLLQGESGTGKELFARALHQLGPRKEQPFVAVNCGALPDTLLESELFGYKAGAFTDARKDKPGRFAAAESGTLFLDEIADVSPAMQVRLLRFLQERVYEPLGSVEPVHADVRVVAATHRDLATCVQEGTFREDLFYRINVVRLDIPPLRERLQDVPLLIEHFIDRFNVLQGKEVTGVTDAAMDCFMAHDYPGNVRELENAIEHAFILCRDGLIDAAHVPRQLRRSLPLDAADADAGDPLKQMEASVIMSTLRRHDWNRTAAAKALGMHKTTLFRKLKALGLQPPLRS